MLKKTIIRKMIRDYLKLEVSSVNNRVFSGRIQDYQDNALFPAISIYNRNENIDEAFQGQSNRSFELVVIGAISHNSNPNDLDDLDFDERIEELQESIEKAMSKLKYADNVPLTDSFKLFENLEYKSSDISFNDATGKNIGLVRMLFDVSYMNSDGIDYNTLDLFAEVDSYLNLDIRELQPISQVVENLP